MCGCPQLNQCEFAALRGLYERLLHRTGHVKVWLSYADIEARLYRDGRETVAGRATKVSSIAVSTVLL